MRLALLLVAAALSVVGVAAQDNAGDPSRASQSLPARAAKQDCPKGLLPLGRNPVSPAAEAALHGERKSDRPRVIGAFVGSAPVGRAPQVVHACGRRIAARSIVVSIDRRAYHSGPDRSASLSQSVVVVGRFRAGWRVWMRLH